MPRLHGVRESMRFNKWDCFCLGADLPYSLSELPSQRLFGPTNIGNAVLSNLYVPGCISPDQSSAIDHWYARTDLTGLSARQQALLDQWSAMTTVTIDVSDKPKWQKPLIDLLRERPWEPESITNRRLTEEEAEAARERVAQRQSEGARPLVVPIRQNISVLVSLHAQEVARKFVEALDGQVMKIWIHLEGIQTRDHG